jgi:O-acetylserine/cysteine efflux transporter
VSVRDFGLLAVVCLLWGANLPLTRWVAADVPPLFNATLRFAGTALLLLPLLRRRPPQLGRVMAVGLFMGGLQFSLQYVGVSLASASASAIAAQLGLPFTVILSAVVLKERVSPRQAAGLVLGIGGVVMTAYDPASLGFSPGLLLVIASAFCVSVAMVLMKRLSGVGALELQAWAGCVSLLPVGLASALLEHDQWHALGVAGPAKWLGILYSILFSSIVGQALFYGLVRRNEVSLVTPLMLMTPLWAIAIGVLALGETLDARTLAGAAATLAGVGLIAASIGRRSSLDPLDQCRKVEPASAAGVAQQADR